jgi:hypothetical protein
MRKSTRLLSIVLAGAISGGFLLAVAPAASAQRVIRHSVVFVGPGPFFGPWPYYGYYPYPPGYAVPNYGEVKIDTHRKDVDVYIDGGYAAGTKDAKKFALRPGNHEIELRDSEGTFYHEKVAVTIGHTTKLHVA